MERNAIDRNYRGSSALTFKANQPVKPSRYGHKSRYGFDATGDSWSVTRADAPASNNRLHYDAYRRATYRLYHKRARANRPITLQDAALITWNSTRNGKPRWQHIPRAYARGFADNFTSYQR